MICFSFYFGVTFLNQSWAVQITMGRKVKMDFFLVWCARC